MYERTTKINLIDKNSVIDPSLAAKLMKKGRSEGGRAMLYHQYGICGIEPVTYENLNTVYPDIKNNISRRMQDAYEESKELYAFYGEKECPAVKEFFDKLINQINVEISSNTPEIAEPTDTDKQKRLKLAKAKIMIEKEKRIRLELEAQEK